MPDDTDGDAQLSKVVGDHDDSVVQLEYVELIDSKARVRHNKEYWAKTYCGFGKLLQIIAVHWRSEVSKTPARKYIKRYVRSWDDLE